jgi:hypothetical protein
MVILRPRFLQLLILSLFFDYSSLCGKVKESDNSNPSHEIKEPEVKESEAKEQKNNSDEDKKPEKKEEPPKIGNFALPTSQQPAALFGFGGNINYISSQMILSEKIKSQ